MRAASILFALSIATLASPARADDLARTERAHKASASASSSSSSSSSSAAGSVASSLVGGVLSSLVSGSGAEGEETLGTPHALAMSSYADDSPNAYADLSGPSKRMRRYGELSASGFTTLESNIRALDAQMNLFLSAFTFHLQATRYYEPDAVHLRTLDLFRFQVGFNLLHGWVNSAELHVTGGILGMHGNDWTPAGSVRADLRVYPFRPFVLDCVTDVSFFAQGPPLMEAQLLPGVTFARLDLRAGVALFYQPDINPTFGPRVSLGIRF